MSDVHKKANVKAHCSEGKGHEKKYDK